MRNHIGPYQRPAPPKRPLGLGASKAVQKPAVPMHEIEARTKVVLQGMIEKVRKPGRPSVHEEPMTAAQRQARRRAFQSRERAIRETLQIGDAHGKSRAEIKSGGYDAAKIDTMYGLGVDMDDDGIERVVSTRCVVADGESNASHEQSYDDIFNSGESSFHRGGFEGHEVERIQVHDLRTGTEELNRQAFAWGILEKLVEEQFESVVTAKAPFLVQRHVGGIACSQGTPEIIYTCRLCGDRMESVDDATDHLRVDHQKLIRERFACLNPPREFRDMGSFVTVVIPRSRKKRLESDD
jgi:hypothetical protein